MRYEVFNLVLSYYKSVLSSEGVASKLLRIKGLLPKAIFQEVIAFDDGAVKEKHQRS